MLFEKDLSGRRLPVNLRILQSLKGSTVIWSTVAMDGAGAGGFRPPFPSTGVMDLQADGEDDRFEETYSSDPQVSVALREWVRITRPRSCCLHLGGFAGPRSLDKGPKNLDPRSPPPGPGADLGQASTAAA